MGDKYCPRAAEADQGFFFTEMGSIAGDHCPGPGAADPFFIGKPVNFALPRTDPAWRQPFPGLCNAAAQISLFMEDKISGLYHFFFSICIQKSYIARS
jgi:hypothetical protein